MSGSSKPPANGITCRTESGAGKTRPFFCRTKPTFQYVGAGRGELRNRPFHPRRRRLIICRSHRPSLARHVTSLIDMHASDSDRTKFTKCSLPRLPIWSCDSWDPRMLAALPPFILAAF
ncbi:hypothetical protein CEXT_347961 [Caerostris extrusa]|uniref:Uncharacterized protein n=1 Tax=Caerostris extrusa TaxID=172846 RepID=A0AAV4RWZ7_CAEEX|nr:hypothetical protein CEXT_347961 [Caerostris extrusa]